MNSSVHLGDLEVILVCLSSFLEFPLVYTLDSNLITVLPLLYGLEV